MYPYAATYAELICAFRDLLEDENLDAGLNDEYVRGGVNLIAEVFGKPDVHVDSRMDEVLADLRSVPAFAYGDQVADALSWPEK